MIKEMSKFFDHYNRKARLYPALIAFLPAIWTTVAFAHLALTDIPNSSFIFVLFWCLLYWFSTISRSRGKIVEQRLLKKWGAWPTTISLRHCDDRIDSVTKARYHARLSTICDGMQFPTVDEETNARVAADDTYRSATKKLMEMRRGPEYQMVHDENASYGFHRNLLGLKSVAVIFGLIVAVVTAIIWVDGIPAITTLTQLLAVIRQSPKLPSLVALDIIFVLTFVVVVTEDFVQQAAYAYADALLRTLDMPTLS